MLGNESKNPIWLNNLVNRVIIPALNRCVVCGKADDEKHRDDLKFERDSSLPEWRGFHACTPRRWGTMPLDIRIRFGRAIRRIREEQGINQEEAAERCGLHRTYYSGIERGVRNVSIVNVEKVARGLKTSLPDLFRRA